MDESAITVRYAKALFLVAKEDNLIDFVKKDIQIIEEVCKKSSDFIRFLKSPVVKTSEKVHIIDIIFKENIGELSLNFLRLITKKKRENYIPAVCRNVLALIKDEKNIKTAVLTTATDIDKSIINKAKNILQKELDCKIEVHNKINPNIIGGVVLRIDDRQYDASISTQLKKLKKDLLKTQV